MINNKSTCTRVHVSIHIYICGYTIIATPDGPETQLFADSKEGRVDVACRCANAALFRSEAYRRNTEPRRELNVGGSKNRLLWGP